MPWGAADEKGPCRPQHLSRSERETGLQVSDFSHGRLEGSACAGADYISVGSLYFGGIRVGEHWLAPGANRGAGLKLPAKLRD